jgi:hypothetical protein
VPLIAQKILDGIYWLVETTVAFIANLDEHSAIADYIEKSLKSRVKWLVNVTPGFLQVIMEGIGNLGSKVPPKVWNSIPLTLLSTLLGILVVPWLLFQVDDFFQKLAERRAKKDD